MEDDEQKNIVMEFLDSHTRGSFQVQVAGKSFNERFMRKPLCTSISKVYDHTYMNMLLGIFGIGWKLL